MTENRQAFLVNTRHDFMRATDGRPEMSLQQFINVTGCRSRFYAVAAFDAIDANRAGRIKFSDYIKFRKLLTFGTFGEKSKFVFSLLDRDNDGGITQEDILEGLKASSDESDKPLTKEELERHLEVLMRLFTDHSTEKIDLKRFQNVLQNYPEVLGSFQVGNAAGQSLVGIANSTKIFVQRKFKYARRWVINHPLRLITYLLTFILTGFAFVWLFWRFSGDCSDADLNYRDPLTNVTRREILDLAREVFNVSMSEKDAQSWAFSSDMKKHDSMSCQNARRRMLLSWTLPLAKGCGRAMKVVFTLILFPVSRSLMTKLRDTSLRHFFDFDGAISYHRWLGMIGFVLAWVHTIAHLVHVYRQQDKSLSKEWCFADPSDRNRTLDISSVTVDTPNVDGIPRELIEGDQEQPNVFEVLSTPVAVTGVVLILIYTAAALFAFDHPKKLSFFKEKPAEDKTTQTPLRKLILACGRILNDFNNFWYTHHLFALFYVVLIFHPMPFNPLEEVEWMTDAWVWILIPVLIYVGDRFHRAVKWEDGTPLLDATTLPGRVLCLKTAKPESMDYKAGQYIMIKCSRVSRFEWHPFTLTSAPQDPYLSVHIRAVGDWTSAMYETLKNCKARRAPDLEEGNNAVLPAGCPVNIKVAGPYGAPSQKYPDYRVVVCVGAGIGVTPFASILSNTLNSIRSTENHKTKKIYFHWIVRSRNEASWFASLLEDIAAADAESILKVCIHITSMKNASDLRLMLLRLAEYESINQNNPSRLISTSDTRFGRPDWAKVLSNHKAEHQEEAKIGVFYCGPNALKKTLKKECEKLSQTKGPSFIFHKEIF